MRAGLGYALGAVAILAFALLASLYIASGGPIT